MQNEIEFHKKNEILFKIYRKSPKLKAKRYSNLEQNCILSPKQALAAEFRLQAITDK